MDSPPPLNQSWSQRQRPPRLECRIGFTDYPQVRHFLEQLESLCEKHQRYPDLSFGRNYVNLTIYPEQENGDVGHKEEGFAQAIDQLL